MGACLFRELNNFRVWNKKHTKINRRKTPSAANRQWLTLAQCICAPLHRWITLPPWVLIRGWAGRGEALMPPVSTRHNYKSISFWFLLALARIIHMKQSNRVGIHLEIANSSRLMLSCNLIGLFSNTLLAQIKSKHSQRIDEEAHKERASPRMDVMAQRKAVLCLPSATITNQITQS
jgi:hypothetical protein